ncbi:MAG: von Willebrand factor type A domain-containing protein, partial [Planctomycetota bacterium]
MKKLFWGATWLYLFLFGCNYETKTDATSPRSHNQMATLGYAAGQAEVESKKKSNDANKTPPSKEAEEVNSEKYKDYGVNPYQDPKQDQFSTFAIDVDTASYTIARRKLNENQIPPKEAVRIEEFINFFPPEYEKNRKDWFKVHLDASPSPFRPKYHLMRVVIQGKDLTSAERKPANLVFLVDVSGSMASGDKLELVKQSLRLLVEALDERDYVSICTYAGSVQTVLQPTNAQFKSKIIDAIEELGAGGSTAMASGILNAYSLANVNFRPEVVNRVIVCSDGDANVGTSNHEEILKLIEDYKDKGITLSTIGFGMGNYQDVMMEQLADKGNGNYSYVDTIAEGKRIFVEQLTGTLQVIAKDMKVQVEFNPNIVK